MIRKERYFLNKECFCEDIDDSLFILHSKTGQYHELNGSGKYILNILDSEGLSIDEILNVTNHGEFKLKKEDVVNFLGQLLKREIICLKK